MGSSSLDQEASKTPMVISIESNSIKNIALEITQLGIQNEAVNSPVSGQNQVTMTLISTHPKTPRVWIWLLIWSKVSHWKKIRTTQSQKPKFNHLELYHGVQSMLSSSLVKLNFQQLSRHHRFRVRNRMLLPSLANLLCLKPNGARENPLHTLI